jgi:hypothetical protein
MNRTFNGNHVHGTIMPRQSSWQATQRAVQQPAQRAASQGCQQRVSTSYGTHSVNRARDLERAAQNRRVHDSYAQRTSYWHEQTSYWHTHTS